jgi:glutamyl-tRNA(Gln) amidotransferase subunit E
VEAYGLNEKLVMQVLESEFSQLFEDAVNRGGAPPTLVAVVLTETLKALRRDGVEVEKVSDRQFLELFRLLGAGEVAREVVPDVITWLAKHEKALVSGAVEALGLSMLPMGELEKIVDGLIEENKGLLAERGERAFGALMGLVMEKVRGRAKADVVAEMVKHRLGKRPGKPE